MRSKRRATVLAILRESLVETPGTVTISLASISASVSTSRRATKKGALFGLARETGMRVGESLGLQWRDVSWADGTVTVRHTLQDLAGKVELAEPNTNSAKRTIRLSQEALAALEAHRDRTKKEKHRVKDLAPVFCDRDGG